MPLNQMECVIQIQLDKAQGDMVNTFTILRHVCDVAARLAD